MQPVKPNKIYPDNWELTAIVDEGAEVHKSAYLAHFSYIMASAIVGPWCIVGAYVLIGDGCTLAEGVNIMSHTT